MLVVPEALAVLEGPEVLEELEAWVVLEEPAVVIGGSITRQHRGGAPYRDRATADRFGGSARGDSLANRQAGARNQVGRQGGNLGFQPRRGLAVRMTASVERRGGVARGRWWSWRRWRSRQSRRRRRS